MTDGTPGRSRRARRGVTFTELLVACALVGILAAAAVPRVDTLRLRAEGSAQLVRGTLQLAQRLAVQHQFDVVVGFDVAGGRMRVTEDRNNDGDPGADRVRWVPLDAGVRFAAPATPVPGGTGAAAVVLSRVRTVGGLPSVIFHRGGSASAALEVYLVATRGARQDVRAVTVVQGTGRTTRFRLLGGGWQEADL